MWWEVLVGDVLQEAVPIAETLGGQTNPGAGGRRLETDHVFLYGNRLIRFSRISFHSPCAEMKHLLAQTLLLPRPS